MKLDYMIRQKTISVIYVNKQGQANVFSIKSKFVFLITSIPWYNGITISWHIAPYVRLGTKRIG